MLASGPTCGDAALDGGTDGVALPRPEQATRTRRWAAKSEDFTVGGGPCCGGHWRHRQTGGACGAWAVQWRKGECGLMSCMDERLEAPEQSAAPHIVGAYSGKEGKNT